MARKPLPTWLASFVARHRGQVIRACCLGAIACACTVLLMFTSGYLISATAQPETLLFSVMVPVAFVQLFGFGRPVARYLERLASHDWVLRVTSDLRLRLYKAFDARFGDPAARRSWGEYLELLSEDVAHLQNMYLRIAFPAVIAYVVSIGACVAFGVFSLAFALAASIALSVVVIAVPALALAATRRPYEAALDIRSETYAKLSDDVSGSTDWVLSGRGADAVSRAVQRDACKRKADERVRVMSGSFTLVSHVVLGLLACATVMWAGWRFEADTPSINWLAALALGFFPLIEVLGALPQSMAETTLHGRALERLGEYVGDDDEATRYDETTNEACESDPRTRNSQAAEIEVSHLAFTYPGAIRPVFENFSLTVPAGQKIAILGKSGSGKSTLADLMSASLAPLRGEILIDGCDVVGHPAQTPRLVGYLGQAPYLFNRTLRENLQMGDERKGDEELIASLREVGLAAKFDSLQLGLDTVVGEGGIGFSGGEAHRIALARVLLASTPIVLVDEPFSALDPETEREMLDLLFDRCAHKTLVVVTHHLAGIDRFDRVLFLEDGAAAIDGAPEELRNTNERFKALLAFDR